ncbi:MAG: hypothetical protein ABIO82_05345 [Ginsengibacter sp.]
MKRIITSLIFITAAYLMTGCSSSKNAAGLKATTGNLHGTWTITNITTDLPDTLKVTEVFDEAPYRDFTGSIWELERNGKGSFKLVNGTNEEIYWSIHGKGDNAQFQFKKLNGMKAKNVEDGYRLDLMNISSNGFVARTPIDIGNGKMAYITYTFGK